LHLNELQLSDIFMLNYSVAIFSYSTILCAVSRNMHTLHRQRRKQLGQVLSRGRTRKEQWNRRCGRWQLQSLRRRYCCSNKSRG